MLFALDVDSGAGRFRISNQLGALQIKPFNLLSSVHHPEITNTHIAQNFQPDNMFLFIILEMLKTSHYAAVLVMSHR